MCGDVDTFFLLFILRFENERELFFPLHVSSNSYCFLYNTALKIKATKQRYHQNLSYLDQYEITKT